MPRLLTPSRRSGFTLIELMVVIVILSILATVAVFAATRYIRSARIGEGVALVGDIFSKQEVFYNTYSVYLRSTDDENEFSGVVMGAPNAGYVGWEDTCPDPNSVWCQLHFIPQSSATNGLPLLRFQLQTIGWAPGVSAPGFVQDSSRRWLTAQARGLYDGSSCVLIRKSSESTELYINKTYKDCGDLASP